MRLRLCPVILAALLSPSCGGPTSPSASPPPPATTPAPTPTPNPGTTSNCNTIQTVAPPPNGRNVRLGTQATFRQGGTYRCGRLTPSTGTGAGRVILAVARGSTRSNAPFDLALHRTRHDGLEPFQPRPSR
jgi:hypothetical protein